MIWGKTIAADGEAATPGDALHRDVAGAPLADARSAPSTVCLLAVMSAR
jgi:hypothetical protein